MKYNIPFYMKDNDSASMVISKINPASTVLEFGCANGRMTKYMKQELNCKVYIIEIEEEAYQIALPFAERGICGDIMDFYWSEQYSDVAFDYILFADVLEHLSDPLEVLIRAEKLLKTDGRIIISIPNVAHSDIVAKLYGGSFDYTRTGILDDTHVRFFTWESMLKLVKEANLSIDNVQTTNLELFGTEQYQNRHDKKPSTLMCNLLRWRADATVFQYILCLKKGLDIIDKPIAFSQTVSDQMLGRVYIDYGDGFSEDHCEIIAAQYVGDGSYRATIDYSSFRGIKRIRYNPVDNQPCIILTDTIKLCESINTIYTNGIHIRSRVLLRGNNPEIIYELLEQKNELSGDIIFQIMGEDFINNLSTMLIESIAENEKYEKDLISLEKAAREIESVDMKIKEIKKTLELEYK